MPKLVFSFDPARCDGRPENLSSLGSAICPMIAEAASAGGTELDPVRDIDWIPAAYPAGSRAYSPVSLEIVTMGFPERIEKLTKERLLALRREIISLMIGIEFIEHFKDDWLLIWMQYMPIEGYHV